MLYGAELVKKLESDIEMNRRSMRDRAERIRNGQTDMDDCFISQRCEERDIAVCKDKINLIKNGGATWFTELATLDGQIVKSRWCNTKYGSSLRVEMPNGEIVWTTATTKGGLAKKGLKYVRCLRPAWYKFYSSQRGMLGVYTGDYMVFPSDTNYATGEEASKEPIEIQEF